MAADRHQQRMAPDPWNMGFGVVTLAAALLALFVWFPLDIKGGFIQTNLTGNLEPGDAFFPILLAAALVALSLVQITAALFNRQSPSAAQAGDTGRLSASNLKFLACFFAILAAGLAIMLWFGPLLTTGLGTIGVIDQSYRQLVDTVPYKYLGYLVGGFAMTTTLVFWTEGRLRPRAVYSVIAVLAACVLIFDILLDNILLPPNADI